MPDAELFSPNSNNTRWNFRGENSGSVHSRPHVEVGLYMRYSSQYDVMRIEQDAFPCDGCHAYFLLRPELVIFRVTADGTGDRAFHLGQGLPAAAGYPCIIYYWNRAVSYNAAPPGAPAHPAP